MASLFLGTARFPVRLLALGALALTVSSCVLIGYDPRTHALISPDAGDRDGASDTLLDGPLMVVSDAQVARDAQPDLVDVGPGPDGGVGTTDDAGTEECPDGGCACPPLGHACAGDLWLSCDALGAVATTVNCRDQVTTACQEGMCDPKAGCVSTPAADGSACDDGLYCTALDTCMNGSCVGSGSPCPDNVCVVQSCNEATDACTVESVNNGASCGTNESCSSAGVCASNSNCSGTCTPTCTGSEATCDLSCQGAASCDTTCVDSQICNIDCHNTNSCATTCDALRANCNLNCEGSQTCTGHCGGGDCALDCDRATTCQNHCGGGFAECSNSCDNTQMCTIECTRDADCAVTSCKGGNCDAHCEELSRCDLNCQDAKSCNATCEWDSTCMVDCRGADNCAIACSYTSQCLLKCDPGDPNCGFTECYGGARKCPNGDLVCHAPCP